jgi:hypothetical protein
VPSRSFSDETERQIRSEYEAGLTATVLGERYGVTYHTICAAVRRAGGKVRPPARRRRIGHRWKQQDGWMVVIAKDDPLAVMAHRERVAEHRLVVARALGRPLRRDEQVHHINGDHYDNRLENLELRYGNHGSGVRLSCLDCGSRNVVPVELAILNDRPA